MSMCDVCHAYGQQLFWGDPACVGMRDLPFVGAAVHGRESFALTFDEVQRITGAPIDHAFLRYKKELADYGYRVGKISMKARTVEFIRDA